MKITNITAFLILALYVDEVSPFSFLGKSLGKRRRSSLKSSEDSTAFFASEVVPVDVSVPYDAAVRLAYESSNKTMAFERFKTIYLDRAVEQVKSKQPGYVPSAPTEPADVSVPYDAAAKLAYESSESRLLFEAYKKVYLEEMVNMVTRKSNERKSQERQKLAAKFTPKPPNTQPPKTKTTQPRPPLTVDEQFAKKIAKIEEEKDAALEKVIEFANTFEFVQFFKNVDFKKPEMQEGVPEESIKGAALLTAGIALLSTKGVIISSAAGISAAFASMQKGQVGDVFRTFGSVTWDATEAATQLVRAATADERVTGLSKELAAKVTGAIDSYQSEQLASIASADPKIEKGELEAAEEELENSPELVAQFLEEVEAVIDQADAAMALADETLGKADMKLDTNEEEFDDSPLDKNEQEIGKIVSSSSDETLIDEPEELDEASISVEDSLEEDNEEETLEPILDEVEDSVDDDEEEVVADEFDDEWAATLELAQQGLDGKIVGMDEVITDAGAKADWDAAGKLAEELGQAGESEGTDEDDAFMLLDDDDEESSESDEDLDDMMPEGDLESIARAAREAVAMSGDSVLEDDEGEGKSLILSDDSDFEVAEDMLPEGDLEDIARAAREAVAMSGETFVDDEDEESFSDSDLEAVDDMMPEGDLEAIARAAREAVAMSSESVVDDDEDDDEELFMPSDSDLDAVDDMMPEGNLEEIARAAREAVAMAEQSIVENDDEDDEEEEDFEDLSGIYDEGGLDAIAAAARNAVAISSVPESSEPSSSPLPLRDWSKLTVTLLREECKVRGIKAYGRKVELVAKLEEYELKLYNGDQAQEDAAEESSDDSDWELEYDEVDLAELGKQARAAVQAYEDLGDEEDDDTEDDSAEPELTVEPDTIATPSADYTKMTVVQLKDQLRSRGLKVSGKKAELIERLQSA